MPHLPSRTTLAIAVLTVAGVAFALASDGYTPFILTLVALTTITGVGLNVLLGLSGQVSFGHVGFYSIGAYTVAVLTMKGVSFWAALLAGTALSGLVGALFALPALRVTGPYLAMMTIAFGFLVEHVTIEWRSVTGGQNGLAGIPQPELGASLVGERAMAVIGVILAGVSMLLYDRLARGRWGKAMVAVRETETAASGIGLDPVRVKTISFALSAAFTGLAGGCFAALMAFVAPSAFPFSQSILFLLAVVIGGAGWTLGPFVGAAITVVLPELISSLAEYRLLIFGVLLLLVLWLAPEGVIGTLARRLRSTPQRAADGTGFEISRFLDNREANAGLQVDGLSIAFGGVRAATGVTLTAEPGRITGLIGPNGAGKTTVLNMISGFYRPDAGTIRHGAAEFQGRSAATIARAGISRTYQTTQLFGALSVIDNVLLGFRAGHLGNPFAPAATAEEQREAEGLLSFVGYRGPLETAASDLAHIDRRLVEIARAVATRPRVLLLDEPAAGLTASDKAHLGEVLRSLANAGLAVMLVEHDMGLVMGICDHLVVLDAGRVIAEGPPAAVRGNAKVRAAYLGSGQMVVQPRSQPVPADAAIVLALSGVRAGYGAVPVLDDLSLDVRQGELVALLGANGAGKSTTMRAVSGLLRPVAGSITLSGTETAQWPAHRVAAAGLALVPEGRQVFPELSVRDNILLGAYANPDIDVEVELAALLARFPRLAERLEARAGLLSGGEAQMLAIARGLMGRPRIVMLDEPSLGLAPAIIEELYKVLGELRDAGSTVLLVDQMAALALQIADRGYVIASGRIVHSGSAADLARDPELEGAYLGRATSDAK